MSTGFWPSWAHGHSACRRCPKTLKIFKPGLQMKPVAACPLHQDKSEETRTHRNPKYQEYHLTMVNVQLLTSATHCLGIYQCTLILVRVTFCRKCIGKPRNTAVRYLLVRPYIKPPPNIACSSTLSTSRHRPPLEPAWR